MSLNPCEMHAVIQGHVQRVGFRATARDYAEELGICGTVRNCLDGTVEIYAQGKQDELDKYLTLLQSTHRIHFIDVDYYAPTKPYEGFHIIP